MEFPAAGIQTGPEVGEQPMIQSGFRLVPAKNPSKPATRQDLLESEYILLAKIAQLQLTLDQFIAERNNVWYKRAWRAIKGIF